jgi:hypothetical protein
MTFTANIIGVGAAATKCYASPNLNLSSTPAVLAERSLAEESGQ